MVGRTLFQFKLSCYRRIRLLFTGRAGHEHGPEPGRWRLSACSINTLILIVVAHLRLTELMNEFYEEVAHG